MVLRWHYQLGYRLRRTKSSWGVHEDFKIPRVDIGKCDFMMQNQCTKPQTVTDPVMLVIMHVASAWCTMLISNTRKAGRSM